MIGLECRGEETPRSAPGYHFQCPQYVLPVYSSLDYGLLHAETFVLQNFWNNASGFRQDVVPAFRLLAPGRSPRPALRCVNIPIHRVRSANTSPC